MKPGLLDILRDSSNTSKGKIYGVVVGIVEAREQKVLDEFVGDFGRLGLDIVEHREHRPGMLRREPRLRRDRPVGVVRGDLPGRLHLQRLDLRRILGQNRLDQAPRGRRLARDARQLALR